MLFRSSLLGACALLFLHVQAQGAVREFIDIELRSNAVVERARVTLADVATIHAEEATKGALTALELGSAPRIGYAERLTRAQIEQLIRRDRANSNLDLGWRGASAVVLRSAAQTVSGTTLSAAATAAVQAAHNAPGGSLHIELAAPVADVDVPMGQLLIRPRPINGTPLSARLPMWLDLLVDGAVYRSVVVQLQPSLRQNVYAAKRNLASGAWVGADDFAIVQADVAGIDAVPVGPQLTPFRLVRALKSGQPLSLTAQAAVGNVLRGDQVRVLVRSGQIGIETTAVVLADAGPGQRVQVRIAGGKDILAGRLDRSGTVTID